MLLTLQTRAFEHDGRPETSESFDRYFSQSWHIDEYSMTAQRRKDKGMRVEAGSQGRFGHIDS